MSKQTKITAFFKAKSVETNETITKSEDVIVVSEKRMFTDDDFVEETSKKQKSNSVKKKCPFYKKIPDTSFAVDAFSYGQIDGVKYYFLTHFHSDHYNGLTKNFNQPIVCSPITGRLIVSQLGVKQSLITVLKLHEPRMIDGVEVVFMDANHCPGAVIILFTLPSSKRILHTGDFRANAEMETISFLNKRPINEIYLDTTYCDPSYSFPTQEETISFIVSICEDFIKKEPKTLIVCGTYSVGKEKVFTAISRLLNLNVWVSPYKRQILNCYQDKELNTLLVNSEQNAQIHVLSMDKINFKSLKDYLQNRDSKFKRLLAFKPTGWEESGEGISSVKPKTSGRVTIYGVPYSEHSSFNELKRFVRFFKPAKVIPTVNVGNSNKRKNMQNLINSWIKP
ncbi:hypothetical protein B4U79_08004 [Dinothrombium tinctorium]|uniref:DNA cross-link repair 1A protein n=1 Tax=Dinothrombium tinctorium TaxID=1965070 RepID=A0A3S3S059_9ACAR|nr:hypothetical protein B4U79_08004 [Dinothrombium tinctorium]